MGIAINSVRDAAIHFEISLEKAFGVDAKESHRRAMAALRKLLSDGATTTQEAYDIVNARLVADVQKIRAAAVAKSEVDSSNGYSSDFYFEPGYKTPPTMSQVLEEEDHARTLANVMTIRDAVASMGSNFDRAATGINFRVDDYSGDERVTVSTASAQAVAGAGAQADIAWPPDLAPGGPGVTQAQLDADEFNAARNVATNFARTSGGRPATAPNGAAGDAPTNFSALAKGRSERRDRDRR